MKLPSRNVLAPLLGLLGVYALFALLGPDSFSSARNLETMARQTTIVGIAAIGMTLVIISGGIDLSAGSIIALSTVVVAATMNAGASPLVSAIAGMGAGAAAGLLNGLIITRLRV
ncbi:MAG: ABC transporter permease, partial [Candidatus Latescibacteria bacterium]|nr:ABC transporter permease [Candidatus Latescibacterota bacterium]